MFLEFVTLCCCVQYIHGLAAKGVHYIHRPGPTLQDLGFFLLPVSSQTFPAIYTYAQSIDLFIALVIPLYRSLVKRKAT